MGEILYRAVSMASRKPNMSQRVLLLNENYEGKFMKEYDPKELVEVKRGVFVEIQDCHIAKNYLLGSYTHWLERV